jgi:mRNA interferase MazF
VQVVPLTSSTGKCFPREALVTLNEAESKAMADQIATVDKRRFENKAGELNGKDMKQVERAIKIQLSLPL